LPLADARQAPCISFDAMRRPVVLGALGGTIVPPLFTMTVVGLTIAEHSFLSKAGWSAVHRTPVEWPSLLALGPYGAVLEIAFILCGGLLGAFGSTVALSARSRRPRFAGFSIATAGVALALEAFKADAPDAAATSWHDVVHDAAYPLIPIAVIGAAGALAFGSGASGWHLVRKWSLPALVMFVVALAATSVDRIAQLGRYFLFGAMLIWLELLAVDALRSARSRVARPSVTTVSRCSCSTS